MRPALTPAQARVYRAIVELYDEDKEIGPSFREIGAKTGLGLQNIHRLIKILIRKGYCEMEYHRARSLRPITQLRVWMSLVPLFVIVAASKEDARRIAGLDEEMPIEEVPLDRPQAFVPTLDP